MAKKLTYEIVKQTFKDGGCVLISDEYVNAITPLRYRCECGNESQISINNFQKGIRCRECGSKRSCEKRRRSYEEVRQLFEDAGCKLLSDEYKNNRTPLRYICKCGNESQIVLSSFKSGTRCGCQRWGRVFESCRLVESRRHSYEFISKEFENAGLTLLTEVYENTHQKLEVRCSCGHEYLTTYADLHRGKDQCNRCSGWVRYTIEEMRALLLELGYTLLDTEFQSVDHDMNLLCKCGNPIRMSFEDLRVGCVRCIYCSKRTRYTIEMARELFQNGGCKLLAEEYVNANTVMPYQCQCGNLSRINLNNFLIGNRCVECGRKKAAETRTRRKSRDLHSFDARVRDFLEEETREGRLP